MAYSLYDAAVTPCAQQLGALAGIIDKAAAHCAANKIEESALLQDRLYPDMFCLARQIRQSADLAMVTGGRLAGVAPPALPAVDDTSFAAAKSRVEAALAFVKSLPRAQVDGAEDKVIAWSAGGNDRKIKGNDYVQQFAFPPGYQSVAATAQALKMPGYGSGVATRTITLRNGRQVETDRATVEDFIDAGICFAGTPDMVFEQMKAFHDHVGGFGHLLMMGQGGHIPHEDTVDNLTLFSKEVLPRLAEFG